MIPRIRGITEVRHRSRVEGFAVIAIVPGQEHRVAMLRGTGVLVAALVRLDSPEAGMCDPMWLPVSRPAEVAFFVAAASGPGEGGVRAELSAGRHNGAALAPGPIVLVPWAYGPDCAPLPWNEARPWTPPTTAAFYTARLRPRVQWIGGVRTFDVHMAWREPMHQVNDPRWRDVAPSAALLTPVELVDFYAAIPTDDELQRKSTVALRRVDAWAVAHPALAAREPARTMIANLNRAMGRAGR